MQGLSLGGEYGTSATYLTEVADERHRGFYSSFQYVTLIGGQLCALLVLLLLQKVFLTRRRDPRLGLAHPVRHRRAARGRRADHAAQSARDRRVRGRQEGRRSATVVAARRSLQYPREVLLVVGLTAGGTAAFYTYTTYMQKFLKLSVGLDRRSDDAGDARRAGLRA